MTVALLGLSASLPSALVGSQFPHHALSWQTRGLPNSSASSLFVHVSPPADARHDGATAQHKEPHRVMRFRLPSALEATQTEMDVDDPFITHEWVWNHNQTLKEALHNLLARLTWL